MGPEGLTLYLSQSRVVDAPWPVKRVSVTNPEIAHVEALTPTSVLLQGKAIGATDLILWSRDEEFRRTKVHVLLDLASLKAELMRMFPKSSFSLSQSRGAVVVSGMLGRAEHAAQLKEFMEASGITYVDMTSVAGVQQVMLQVRILEESRTATHAVGFTALVSENKFLGALNLGPDTGGAIDPVIIKGADPIDFTGLVTVSPVFLSYVSEDLKFFVQALADTDYLRILAEPTLVALSGEEATFLVGGEFPVPVVRATVLDKPTISIQFKEYGVRLKFRPTVLGDGTIRLLVASEVSDLSTKGAIEVSGFFVPSLIARKAETTLELKSGQSFAMAGLILTTIKERTSGIPGLADLPVIGAMFRAIHYEKTQTDLVVLSTAWLVDPLASTEKPRKLSDWEYFASGDVETGAPALVAAAATKWLKQMKFNSLRGFGAWDAGTWEVLQGWNEAPP